MAGRAAAALFRLARVGGCCRGCGRAASTSRVWRSGLPAPRLGGGLSLSACSPFPMRPFSTTPPLLVPPKSGSGGLDLRRRIYDVVAELRRYLASTRLLLTDLRMSFSILADAVRGTEVRGSETVPSVAADFLSQLTPREWNHVRGSVSDVFRLVPLAVILALPGARVPSSRGSGPLMRPPRDACSKSRRVSFRRAQAPLASAVPIPPAHRRGGCRSVRRAGGAPRTAARPPPTRRRHRRRARAHARGRVPHHRRASRPVIPVRASRIVTRRARASCNPALSPGSAPTSSRPWRGGPSRCGRARSRARVAELTTSGCSRPCRASRCGPPGRRPSSRP